MRNLIISISILLFVSCSRTGVVKFQKKEDDTYTKGSLQKILNSNEIKVLLRTPEKFTQVESESTDYELIYHTIEREFVKAGMSVKDRALFSDVLDNSGGYDNYDRLSEISNTDIIIELVDINPSVEYITNKYYNGKNEEKIIPRGGSVILDGASIEFKIINIKGNEVAGIYNFHYTPCLEGCKYTFSGKGVAIRHYSASKKSSMLYEFSQSSVLEEFIGNAAIQLIEEMRYN